MAPNRLVHEDSSYLKQHANNPVDWYPWGDEAFAEAANSNRPIFLSIGYSTCHWCHVMERESFADLEIAAFLNEHFVSVKLDREQRPDLDELYMTGLQLMGLQGGWPMSLFTNHQGEPFFGGTYFPPHQFLERLKQIQALWQDRRDDVMQQASQLSANIDQMNRSHPGSAIVNETTIQTAISDLLARFDSVNGGFSHQPKFPMEPQLLFILDSLRRHPNEALSSALHLTLQKMAEGGLFDQVAGGFHRYSVDAAWQVPHFEKMLYNQALLIQIYTEAGELLGDPYLKSIGERTTQYVLRDLTSKDGRFFSATDADSEGEEGRFFVWTLAELTEVLSTDQLTLVNDLYDVTAEGNFDGANVLALKRSLDAYRVQTDTSNNSLQEKLNEIHDLLYRRREQRVKPLRDEKFVASWNGMMISALVRTGHLVAAERAAESVWKNQVIEDKLFRVGFGESASTPATLEDYAYVANAYFELYYALDAERWLSRGQRLTTTMNKCFWDDSEGGYFVSESASNGPLISRSKNPKDSAIPSANAVALKVLLTAFETTGSLALKQQANRLLATFSQQVIDSPIQHCSLLIGSNQLRDGSRASVQFASDGNIRVQLCGEAGRYKLDFALQPGWHVNANTVADKALIATSVVGATAEFPEPKLIQVAYQEEKLPVFEDTFTVNLTNPGRHVIVCLQPCNDQVCLKPETLTFYVPN